MAESVSRGTLTFTRRSEEILLGVLFEQQVLASMVGVILRSATCSEFTVHIREVGGTWRAENNQRGIEGDLSKNLNSIGNVSPVECTADAMCPSLLDLGSTHIARD